MTSASTPYSNLLPDWAGLYGDYISPRTPVRIVVVSEPAVEVFFDGTPARMGVRFALEGRFNPRLREVLSEIRIEEVVDCGDRFIEMWTDQTVLFPSFYSLAREIVGEVVNNETRPVDAIAAAVDQWNRLLTRPSFLSEEKQIGLFGELWVLRRLIGTMGAAALDAWVGPIPEVHDFRTSKAEFEVKTTTGAERRHTINGLGQLTPSVGWPLFLVSIQITNGGGGGLSLPEAVDEIRGLLEPTPGAVDKFEALLGTVQYEEADRNRYTTKYKSRSEPILVPIIENAPRLTKEALSNLPERFSPERISDVTYEIDVSGLGYVDGSSPFLDLIPNG